jgi:rhamnose transport system permease protein
MMRRSGREASVAIAIAVLCVVLAAVAPGYFSGENLNDLFLANTAVFVVALGATLVILAGEIDISVGSVFAVAGVVAGVVAKLGAPGGVWTAAAAACFVGAIVGAVNGALVAHLQVPSIVVTLAMMVALRDGLRWATQGAWVENLPPNFQWFGLPQSWYPVLLLPTLAIVQSAIAWGMRHVAAGRMVYATGSNASAARLAGIHVTAVKWWVFVVAGTLAGLAAVLNAVRFNQIPSNSGLGLEMKVIAAVVVGGTAITGGRGTFTGTLLGVLLLGAIGPGLTFLGVSAYWERAIHGAIILGAVAIDATRARRATRSISPVVAHA